MAQLIKLQNYTSRYERDLFRYPSQYIRLKKQEWEKFQSAWENRAMAARRPEPLEEDWLVEEKRPFFKSFFKRKEPKEAVVEEQDEPEEDRLIYATAAEAAYWATANDVKKAFLEKMFHFQVQWASSTLVHESPLDHRYLVDGQLKFLLMRLPDTFFVLYKPVFRFQKAVVELDVIVLTPSAALCVSFLEEEDDAAYTASTERFWLKKYGRHEARALSPAVSLGRTETVVKKLFQHENIELPVEKVIISRNGYIDKAIAPADIRYIDKRAFAGWLDGLQHFVSPMKTVQLKAAQTLLTHTETVYKPRSEWKENEQ